MDSGRAPADVEAHGRAQPRPQRVGIFTEVAEQFLAPRRRT